MKFLNLKYLLILLLLLCGVLAPLLYFVSDIICALSYPGYSYADQAISELSAIGSPTAELWRKLMLFFSPLVIAFGIGVSLVAQNRHVKISGILIFLFGLSGYIWFLFPMNLRGNIGSTSDTGHLVMAGVTVFLLTAFISFGAGASGKCFRFYSIVTIALMLTFGILVAMAAPKVAANQPTPLMGIYERISVFSSMLWMLVLAIILLKERKAVS